MARTVLRGDRRSNAAVLPDNTVHWTKDCTFGEDASQIRRHNTPAVMTAIRDIVRGTLTLAGWVNIASGRRAHTTPEDALILHGIP